MTRSVESRFIAIIIAALLIVVAPLFTLFLALSSRQVAESLKEHVEVIIAANAQALAKPLWDLDVESIRQITGALLNERGIQVVQVTDTLGKLDVVESRVRDASEQLQPVSRQIFYRTNEGFQTVGTLVVRYEKVGLFSALTSMEIALISIFAVAILTVVGAAILGNRTMVIRPLMRLTAAVEATRQLGSRHHVDWRSADEMGRLAKSFNQMQIQLEREERELKRAHQQTTEIYNLTPAMLFSLDGNDMIFAVSDYWLLATGYARDTVLGRPFVDLVVPQDHETYKNRKQMTRSIAGVCEVTVRFLCADGRTMDVLILETALTSSGDDLPASLSVMTDVTELKQSETRNRRQAISDHLTGLLNRQGFEAVLDEKIAAADRQQSEVACLFVDLDRFKQINDTLGHAAGDSVLCQFVERIQPLMQSDDAAARLGGDEFAILITGEGAERRAVEIAQRIVDHFELPFRTETTSVRLSASIGLAFYPRHAASASELLQRSDMAMYARKREGKNGANIFDNSISERARQRAEIESDIEVAIAANWFEAHFQPIMDVAERRIVGFEALMRMRHPRKGLMSPAGIIDVAEETGSIGQIGNLILEDSLANLAQLSRLPGMENAYVAVNFSPLQFEPSLPIRLTSLMARYAIAPQRLVIEITEAVLMHDNPQIRTVLDTLHSFGYRIALDDFGTGYSSLSYLSRFPVDIVKIDQSFIRSLGQDAEDVQHKSRMLVEGISAISHKMNCAVVAEGVETEHQFSLLNEIGIDFAQGYLFSRPLAINEIVANIRKDLNLLETRAG
ncbi:putative bifunctional diguanylate cyclase/phosphodiesterase [Affinirhizobium pseudoryzae]|uniref:putative bifunctional diguanylate cyclase/phosphodiesterase n=1 Tax=Allorhizobium pseudoryzae TaxID=379684 RepID=UPI0013EDBA5F|nr:EAL domain-containing protein [Allorhizobium pseudoryzae]